MIVQDVGPSTVQLQRLRANCIAPFARSGLFFGGGGLNVTLVGHTVRSIADRPRHTGGVSEFVINHRYCQHD